MKSAEIVVINYFNEVEVYKIKARSVTQSSPTRLIDANLSKNALCLNPNGIEVYFLLKEILKWSVFRRLLLKFLLSNTKSLHLRIEPPIREPLDYKWNEIASFTVWERVEIENLMSWLSTLGGGFSALGDSFSKCAETARKISLKQLALGIRIGDPFVQARCKLFYSISLIQTGRLRFAKYIIREQYKFASYHKETDHRLVKMCEGIWLKLRYTYKIRHQRQIKHISSER